jgi:hypothetical protein
MNQQYMLYRYELKKINSPEMPHEKFIRKLSLTFQLALRRKKIPDRSWDEKSGSFFLLKRAAVLLL